jgi:inositol oxygenase
VQERVLRRSFHGFFEEKSLRRSFQGFFDEEKSPTMTIAPGEIGRDDDAPPSDNDDTPSLGVQDKPPSEDLPSGCPAFLPPPAPPPSLCDERDFFNPNSVLDNLFLDVDLEGRFVQIYPSGPPSGTEFSQNSEDHETGMIYTQVYLAQADAQVLAAVKKTDVVRNPARDSALLLAQTVLKDIYRPLTYPLHVYAGSNQPLREEAQIMLYKEMHAKQTVEYVLRCRAKYEKFQQCEMTIEQAMRLLDTLEQDEDHHVADSLHDVQTAERIRREWPGEQYDWFHLTGLLHDMGKILFFFGEEQWSVVGDTFPVGCQYSDACVFSEFFGANPDFGVPAYQTPNGIYERYVSGRHPRGSEPNCGFQNVLLSYGHDEYMYQFLKKHSSLPELALYIVRYHSFYPWHSENAYAHLASTQDRENLKWLKEFNRFDCYCACGEEVLGWEEASEAGKEVLGWEEVGPYYKALLDKYGLGGKLRW